jgi:hypothetical protein
MFCIHQAKEPAEAMLLFPSKPCRGFHQRQKYNIICWTANSCPAAGSHKQPLQQILRGVRGMLCEHATASGGDARQLTTAAGTQQQAAAAGSPVASPHQQSTSAEIIDV